MEIAYSWFKLLQEIAVGIAATVAIAVAWFQYRKHVISSAREWSPWVTHVATALAATLVPAVIWLNSSRLAQNTENELVDVINERINDVIASTNTSLSSAVRLIDGRLADIASNQRRITDRQDDIITQLADVQTRLAVAEVWITERRGADAGQPSADVLANSAPTSALPDGPEPMAEVRDRTYEYGYTNQHCQPPERVNRYVEATEGWSIVPESIKISPFVQSSKSVWGGVTPDPSGRGFTVHGEVVNRGDCVRIFRQIVARDARGTLRVAGTYQERRDPK
jgi:hypothetical protein